MKDFFWNRFNFLSVSYTCTVFHVIKELKFFKNFHTISEIISFLSYGNVASAIKNTSLKALSRCIDEPEGIETVLAGWGVVIEKLWYNENGLEVGDEAVSKSLDEDGLELITVIFLRPLISWRLLLLLLKRVGLLRLWVARPFELKCDIGPPFAASDSAATSRGCCEVKEASKTGKYQMLFLVTKSLLGVCHLLCQRPNWP